MLLLLFCNRVCFGHFFSCSFTSFFEFEGQLFSHFSFPCCYFCSFFLPLLTLSLSCELKLPLHSLSLQRRRSQSFRRQSAPSLSISRALTRSKTLSRCFSSTTSNRPSSFYFHFFTFNVALCCSKVLIKCSSSLPFPFHAPNITSGPEVVRAGR